MIESGIVLSGPAVARAGSGLEHYSGFVCRNDARLRRVAHRARDSAQRSGRAGRCGSTGGADGAVEEVLLAGVDVVASVVAWLPAVCLDTCCIPLVARLVAGVARMGLVSGPFRWCQRGLALFGVWAGSSWRLEHYPGFVESLNVQAGVLDDRVRDSAQRDTEPRLSDLGRCGTAGGRRGSRRPCRARAG